MSQEIKPAALTPEEHALLHTAWSQGPSAFVDAGMAIYDIQAFLLRPEVRSALALLEEEYRQQHVIEAKSRFSTRKALHRLAQPSVVVLEQALAGGKPLRYEDGGVVNDAVGHPIMDTLAPSGAQIQAAGKVLDLLGIEPRKDRTGMVVGTGHTLDKFVNQEVVDVELQADPTLETEEERALSRERIRNVITYLSKEALPQARAEIAEAMTPDAPLKKKKKKKAPDAVTS